MTDDAKKPPSSAAAGPAEPSGRVFARLPITKQVQINFPGVEAFERSFSRNISLGGMFIKTDREIAIGTKIEFRFNLDNEQKVIAGTGEVVRLIKAGDASGYPPGWGIKFTTMDQESRTNLELILSCQ